MNLFQNFVCLFESVLLNMNTALLAGSIAAPFTTTVANLSNLFRTSAPQHIHYEDYNQYPQTLPPTGCRSYTATVCPTAAPTMVQTTPADDQTLPSEHNPNGHASSNMNWITRNYQLVANIINVASVGATVLAVFYLVAACFSKLRKKFLVVLGIVVSVLVVTTNILRDWTTKYHIVNTLKTYGCLPSQKRPPVVIEPPSSTAAAALSAAQLENVLM